MPDSYEDLVHFVPGGATALAGSSLAALLVTGPDDELVSRLWDVVATGGTFDAALTVLGAHGFERLPPFAVLGWVAGTARVVVRGEVVVDLLAGDVSVASVLGGDVHSWAEHAVAGAQAAVLRTAEASQGASTPHRVTCGVVPAERVLVRAPAVSTSTGFVEVPPEVRTPEPVDDPEPTPLEQLEAVAEPDEVPEPEPPTQRDAIGEPDVPASSDVSAAPDVLGEPPARVVLAVPGEPAEASPDRTPVSRSTPVDLSKSELTITETGLAAPPPVVVPPPVGPPSSGPAGGMFDEGYDHLFGATEYRSVEGAAVRPEDPPGSESGAGAAVDSASPADADHDGHTITMSELEEQRASGDGSGPAAGGDGGVLAVRCADGHLNPPHADACRACGSDIFTQAPIRLDAPDLGVLQFSHGPTVQLVRPLLIGRSPKLSGALPSGGVPDLVAVPSPNQDISRTHLEVRVEGWRVMVVDRDSTNGTTVALPGRAPQRLRPDEPYPIPPGARVSLAEEIEFTFEVPR